MSTHLGAVSLAMAVAGLGQDGAVAAQLDPDAAGLPGPAGLDHQHERRRRVPVRPMTRRPATTMMTARRPSLVSVSPRSGRGRATFPHATGGLRRPGEGGKWSPA